MTFELKVLDTIPKLDDSDIPDIGGSKIINKLSGLYKIKLNEKFETYKNYPGLACNSTCLILIAHISNEEGIVSPHQTTSLVLNSSKLQTFQATINNS